MPNATAINKRQEYLTNDSHSEYQYIYGNKENGKVVRSDKKLDDPNLVLITRDLTGMRHSLPKEDEVEFANMFKSKEGRKQLDEFILSMPKSERENVSYMDAFLEMKHGKEYLASIRNGVRKPENVKEYNILDDETSHVYKTQKEWKRLNAIQDQITSSSDKKFKEMKSDATEKLESSESYKNAKTEAEKAKAEVEKTKTETDKLIANKKKEIESVESKLNKLSNKTPFVAIEHDIKTKTLNSQKNELERELKRITEKAKKGILAANDKATKAETSLFNKLEYEEKIKEINRLKDKLKRVQDKIWSRANKIVDDKEYSNTIRAVGAYAKSRASDP